MYFVTVAPTSVQSQEPYRIERAKKKIMNRACLDDFKLFFNQAIQLARALTGIADPKAALETADARRYNAACELVKVNSRLSAIEKAIESLKNTASAVNFALVSSGADIHETSERTVKTNKEEAVAVRGGVVVVPTSGIEHARSTRDQSNSKSYLQQQIEELQMQLFKLENERIPLQKKKDGLLEIIREVNRIEGLLKSALLPPAIILSHNGRPFDPRDHIDTWDLTTTQINAYDNEPVPRITEISPSLSNGDVYAATLYQVAGAGTGFYNAICAFKTRPDTIKEPVNRYEDGSGVPGTCDIILWCLYFEAISYWERLEANVAYLPPSLSK